METLAQIEEMQYDTKLLERGVKPERIRHYGFVVMTVAGEANCKLDYNALDRKGDADMCTVFEETRMEGRIEGRIEGRTEGRIEGIIKMLKKYNESDETIINELIVELGISEEIAKEYLDKYNQEMQKNHRNV